MAFLIFPRKYDAAAPRSPVRMMRPHPFAVGIVVTTAGSAAISNPAIADASKEAPLMTSSFTV